MHIQFYSLTQCATFFFQENLFASLTDQEKKILIIASAALSCLAIFTIARHCCFQASVREDSETPSLFSPSQPVKKTEKIENESIEKQDEQHICPITLEPFKEPYYCLEDGYTYEKEAIIKWIQTSIQDKKDRGLYSDTVKSPAGGMELKSFTLYPNKALFSKGGIPSDQKPMTFDIPYLMQSSPGTKSNLIFDDKIRSLIEDYSHIPYSDYSKKKSIKELIHKRRTELKLNINSPAPWNSLDLSYLDLSNMKLKNLDFKGAIFKETNLSKTILEDCQLGRCQFLSCNLQETSFIACSFPGEEVSFFNSDMYQAVFQSKHYCSLEKGSSWNPCWDWNEFKQELKIRGALNVDTIECKNI